MDTGNAAIADGTTEARSKQIWVTGVLVGAVAVVGGGGLIAFSGDDTLFGRLPVVLVGLWFVIAVPCAVLRRPRVLVALLVTSLAVVGVGLLEVPMRLRANLSESRLAAAAVRLEAGESVGRVGLYWPTNTWYDEETGCAIFETQSFIIDGYGVAYCGEGSRPNSFMLEHLAGDVYRYSDG